MKSYYIIITQLIIGILYSQEIPDREPITGESLEMKITIKVIGEDGLPVSGADTHVRIIDAERFKDGSNDFKGMSNADGEFTVESKTTAFFVPISIKKEGYYESEMQYWYPYELHKNIKFGERLLPWNPTIPIILKKIGHGAPMFVRTGNRKGIYLPILGEQIGFDLVADDWVAPHGKGKVADMMILAELDASDAKNFEAKMSLSFPNKNDGWIGLEELRGIESELRYPREAPLGGYRNDPIHFTYKERNPYIEEPITGGYLYAYILRLRTERDDSGNVISAIYAKIIQSDKRRLEDIRKIYNPIQFGGNPGDPEIEWKRQGCYFVVDYYLNPKPNDRTLEFDRKNNLAPEAERLPTAYDP